MDVRLVERLYPEWNAAHVFRLRTEPRLDPGAVAGLARCPELTPALRDKFAAQLATLDAADMASSAARLVHRALAGDRVALARALS